MSFLDTSVNPTVEKVEAALRSTKGVLDVKWLDQETRKSVFDLEEKARQEGLSSAGSHYYNEGVAHVLSREFVGVVLNNNKFRHATAPSLFWIAGNMVIGEEVTDALRLQELAKNKHVKILRRNFVLYFDRMKAARGQAPTFVIRGLPFPEIEGIAGVSEVLSASPIGSADVYFKERFGWDSRARDLGTILIGFNLA